MRLWLFATVFLVCAFTLPTGVYIHRTESLVDAWLLYSVAFGSGVLCAGMWLAYPDLRREVFGSGW